MTTVNRNNPSTKPAPSGYKTMADQAREEMAQPKPADKIPIKSPVPPIVTNTDNRNSPNTKHASPGYKTMADQAREETVKTKPTDKTPIKSHGPPVATNTDSRNSPNTKPVSHGYKTMADQTSKANPEPQPHTPEDTIVREEKKGRYSATPGGPPVLSILVPMRRYHLTVSHVLLAKLGGISHFILSVLESEGGTLQRFAEISGLTASQSDPLLHRLEALGLVRDGGLTTSGRRMAYILRHVHEQTAMVWLDALQERAPLLVVGDGLPQQFSGSVDDCFWASPRHKDPVTDCNLQRQRLKSHFPNYLVDVFPQLSGIPDAAEKYLRGSEWEISLRDEKLRDYALAIQVRRSDAGGEGRVALTVASPISVLETTWSIPDALPPAIPVAATLPMRRYFRHADRQIGDPGELVAALNTEAVQVRVPQWPTVTAEEQQGASAALFGLIVEDATTASPLLNRSHNLVMNWEMLRFTWDIVRNRCRGDHRVVCAEWPA